MRKIGETGYDIRHLHSGKVKTNVSRNHLYTFTEREGDEAAGAQQPPAADQAKETEETDEEKLEEAEEEKAQDEAEEGNLKRTLEESEQAATQPANKIRALAAHNKPTIHLTPQTNPTIGHMALVRDGKTARLGEIVEVNDEEVLIHWYGTSTNKMFPRTRWKFYPGWSDEDGVVQYVRAQKAGAPARSAVNARDIIRCFPNPTLKSTIPADVVEETKKFAL